MSAAEPTIETIASERYVPEAMRAVWVSIILVMSPSPGVSVAFVSVRAASIYFSLLSSERGAIPHALLRKPRADGCPIGFPSCAGVFTPTRAAGHWARTRGHRRVAAVTPAG